MTKNQKIRFEELDARWATLSRLEREECKELSRLRATLAPAKGSEVYPV